MTADKNKWGQWEAATGFRGRVQKLAEKHRLDRATSPEKYLAQRRSELACEIENKKLIYLDTNALPSVEIVAGRDVAIALESNRSVQANDMLDFLHAAQALPYCDAVFCDNFMAQKMKNRSLEFAKTYKTEIGSRPEEIVACLNTLN